MLVLHVQDLHKIVPAKTPRKDEGEAHDVPPRMGSIAMDTCCEMESHLHTETFTHMEHFLQGCGSSQGALLGLPMFH